MTTYKEIEAYSSIAGFIEGHKSIWDMFNITYECNKNTVVLRSSFGFKTIWKLNSKGEMVCP